MKPNATLLIFFILLIACKHLYAIENDSTSILSRFRVGFYAMGNKVTSPDKDIIKYHTKDGNNILGTGITYGLNIQYNFSGRRALRLGILMSQQKGRTQVMQEFTTPFDNNPPAGYYYYLIGNEWQIRVPIAFQYRFLKEKKRISPYVFGGYNLAYSYKFKWVTSNSQGYIPNSSIQDGTTVNKTWQRANVNGLLLGVGVDCNINKKISFYLEPLYGKTGEYLGYNSSAFQLNTFNYFGIGLGINYKL